MKIKCFDKYREQWLILKFGDLNDKISLTNFSSNSCWGDISVEFEAINGEDPSPERWSDLIKFEIIDEIFDESES